MNSGTVKAWGLNSKGQLGDGTVTTRITPIQVSDPTDVIAVATGQYHSLALTKDGEVWPWGKITMDSWVMEPCMTVMYLLKFKI